VQCPADCLPLPPSGWTGPNAVYDGADATPLPACPTDYPTRDLEVRKLGATPDFTCACTGGDLTGSPRCSADFTSYGTAACNSGGGTPESTLDGCSDAPVGGADFHYTLTNPKATGTCTAVVPNNVPVVCFPAGWLRFERAD